MWPRHFLQDESGDGTGNDGGAGGNGSADDGQQNKVDPLEVVGKVQKQVEVLTNAMTIIANSQKETQEMLRTQQEAIAAASQRREEHSNNQNDNSGDLFSGVNVEELDRKEFGTLLLTKFMDVFKKNIDGALQPVQEQIKSIQSTVTNDLGSRQVADTLKDNKDLYEWKDELAALIKETPGLKLNRALAIARAENPEKAAAMAKKYKPAGGDGEQKGNVTFLGLTPTSRRTAESDGKSGKMKFNEAAESAFNEVLAGLGASSFDQVMPSRR